MALAGCPAMNYLMTSLPRVTGALVRRTWCRRRYCLPPSRLSAMAASPGAGGGDDSRKLTVTRIFSDENGESHFGSFTIQMTGSGDIGYLSEKVSCAGAIIFRHTPASYNYSWHNAPRRQFIVNLDGEVEVEVSSGEKRVLSRGEIFFVEDLTGKGHYSRSVDGQPRHSIFLAVPDDFVARDC